MMGDGNRAVTAVADNGHVGDLLDDYRVSGWDEMLDSGRRPRPAYRALYEAFQSLSTDDLAARAAARDRALYDQGISFSL